MKRALLAGVGLFAMAGVVQSASAADVPTARPVLKASVAAPVFNWSGFYVGGNVGYAWGDRRITFAPNDSIADAMTCLGSSGSTCAPPSSFDVDGAFGGPQAGYNYQFNQSWLLGIESDFNWSGIQGRGTSNFLMAPDLFPPGTASFDASQNVKWFGTVRGRLGFLPTNNLLIYGTAGFAYGRVDANVALNAMPGTNAGAATHEFSCAAGPDCFVGSSSRTRTGWTAGAGLEIMVASNLTFKLEYLYVNLGSENVKVVAVNPGLEASPRTPSSFTARYDDAALTSSVSA